MKLSASKVMRPFCDHCKTSSTSTAVVPAGACSVRSNCRRSEEHTSELQSLRHLVCRLLFAKKKTPRRFPIGGGGSFSAGDPRRPSGLGNETFSSLRKCWLYYSKSKEPRHTSNTRKAQNPPT